MRYRFRSVTTEGRRRPDEAPNGCCSGRANRVAARGANRVAEQAGGKSLKLSSRKVVTRLLFATVLVVATLLALCGGGDVELDPYVRLSVVAGSAMVEIWPAYQDGMPFRLSSWWVFREPFWSCDFHAAWERGRLMLEFPVWLPLCMAVSGGLVMHAFRRGRPTFPSCCEKCGYSLVALTVPRCPECGTLFDPSHVLRRTAKHAPEAPDN